VFRRVLVLLSILSTFLLVLAVITALALISARRSLLSGVDELRVAQSQLQLHKTGTSLQAILTPVRSDVTRARDDFRSADQYLGPLSPLLTRLAWVPRVGGEVAVAPPIAHAAQQTADGALFLLAGFRPLTAQWTDSSRRPSAPAIVTSVAAGRVQFDRACGQFADAQRSLRPTAGVNVPTSLSSALGSLRDRLPILLTLCRALVLAPSMLGADRPVSYLVAYQDANELRASGGFIGSASVITLRRGVASQVFESTGIADNLSVPPPEPVAYYNGEPGWLFRDSNWSPDFPTTAALERFFYQLDFHRDVPNVVDLTPQASSDILSATGPIYVSEYHRWVTGADVAALADYYAHYAPNAGLAIPSSIRGKQFIGIVAAHILHRLTSLSPSAWVRLGEAVASAVAHGDMLVNFRDPARQSLIQAAGASHAVTPGSGDYLYLVDTNLSYNKINPFVHLQTSYDVRIRPDRWLDAHLVIRVQNVPAPPAIARFGIGPGAGSLGGTDDYATFLRLYTPPGAALIDQTGWTQPWTPGPAYGGTMFSGYLLVPHGTTRTVRLHYIVPPNVFRAAGGQRYTLLMPHQPGSHPDRIHVRVEHDGAVSSWTINHPALDWKVAIPINSRAIHLIPLPIPPRSTVRPGHWIEPHAYLGVPNPRG
jgi:Protein of unknown function (DUF4012)